MKFEIQKAFEKQLEAEFIASELYLELSEWAKNNNFIGCTHFLVKHSEEELEHYQYILDYLNEISQVVCMPTQESISIPKVKIENILELFEAVLLHEKQVTKVVEDFKQIINKHSEELHELKLVEWLIEEQKSEEELFTMIIDDISKIGLENTKIIDEMLSSMRCFW